MFDFFKEVFSTVVEIVSEHPYEAAAVVTTTSAFAAGYGMGYHDGIQDERGCNVVALN